MHACEYYSTDSLATAQMYYVNIDEIHWTIEDEFLYVQIRFDEDTILCFYKERMSQMK